MTKVGIYYDYSGVDQVVEIPTTGQLIIFQTQMAKVQSKYKCNIVEAKVHGWSQTMCTQAQWILKRGITTQVPVSTKPGPYTFRITFASVIVSLSPVRSCCVSLIAL